MTNRKGDNGDKPRASFKALMMIAFFIRKNLP